MRNYILGHTQAVNESNYQSHRVEKDLSGLAFGNVKRKLELFKELGNMSLKRDRGAPLYVSSQGHAQLDRRRDITLLRRLIETSTKEPEHRQTLHLRANELMQQLHRLWLAQARKEYFAEAAALRQQGKEPADQSFSQGSAGTAANVAFLIEKSMDAESVGNTCTRQYAKALLSYLRKPPYASTKFGEPVTLKQTPMSTVSGSSQNEEDTSETKHEGYETTISVKEWKDPPNVSRCLICSSTFTARYNLTKHYRRKHLKDGLFTKPFSCPLCHEEIDGSMGWSSHVERTHGSQHAPQLDTWRTQPNSQHFVYPFLCQKLIKDESSLIIYINRCHIGPRTCFVVSRETIYN